MAKRPDVPETALTLEEFLPYRIAQIAEAVSLNFSAIYKSRYGLGRPEWRCLATLGQLTVTTATEISDRSGMHRTKVSRAIHALEQRHWLIRAQLATDRRAEHLTLTPTGRAVYQELAQVAKDYQASLLARVSPAKRDALLAGLDVLEELVADIKS